VRGATAWRVLAAEGPRAAAARALDRLAEARRRRSFASLDFFGSALEATLGPPAAFPVLLLTAAPPAPRFGGVQAALLARIDEEEQRRPVALLYPRRGAWRLELTEGHLRRAAELAADAPPHPAALEDAELERVVAWAVERCGARALQVEGAAGLPLASLLRLAGEGLPLVLALHDFALFCPRPHLLETPAHRFCDYSRDAARCAACLAATWPGPSAPAGLQDRRREAGAALLAGAAAAVFPSEFLRRAHAALFPGALPARTAVIPPARPPGPLPPSHSPPAGPLRRVALVGGGQAHKGAELLAEVVERLAGTGLTFAVYGGGDPALLRRLRRLPGVEVRGYYRAGSLPCRLRREGAGLALLLSVVPESYGLALSECRLAGLPALAFDHGAVADRIRAEGGGLLVDPAAGAAGIAARLAALASGEEGVAAIPPLRADLAADGAGRVTDRWHELYREIGLSLAPRVLSVSY
jgi:glycosyltransferase involved in cell wall biosynthesis